MNTSRLTKRQKQIVSLSAKGLSNNEIANKLKITKQAVSQTKKEVLKKEEKALKHQIINIAKEKLLTIDVDQSIKQIKEFQEFEGNSLEELVEKMIKRQMMANILFHEKAIENTDPMYLRAIADHSKTLNEFILAYSRENN